VITASLTSQSLERAIWDNGQSAFACDMESYHLPQRVQMGLARMLLTSTESERLNMVKKDCDGIGEQGRRRDR